MLLLCQAKIRNPALLNVYSPIIGSLLHSEEPLTVLTYNSSRSLHLSYTSQILFLNIKPPIQKKEINCI